MSTIPLRPQSAVGIIDTTAALLRRRYWDCVLAALIPALPMLVLALLVPPQATRLVTLFIGLTQPISVGIIAVLVSESYTGQPVSIGGALARGGRRAFGLLGVGFVSGLYVSAGFIALIVPGFIVLAWLYTAGPVYVLEEISVPAAIRRARDLARGSVGRVLVVWLGMFIAYEVLAITAGGFVGAVWGLLQHTGSIPRPLPVIFTVIIVLAAQPIVDVPRAVLYYDLRIRREALDLDGLLASLAPPSPAAVDAAGAP